MNNVYAIRERAEDLGGRVVSDEKREESVANTQPSFAELAAALKSLQQPQDQGMSKHISTIVVGATLAIGAWLMNGLGTVQNDMASVRATVESIDKNGDQVNQDIREMKGQLTAIQTENAQTKQRLDALEGRSGGRSGYR